MLNIFKIGRGDFFGTIIPGAFLLINFLFLYPEAFDGFRNKNLFITLYSKNVILIPLLFIISYTLGFALRVIKPTTIEKLSSLLWTPHCIIKSYFIHKEEKTKNVKLKFSTYVKKRIKLYWESFPYIYWFFSEYFDNAPASYKDFYNKILKEEFQGEPEKMKGLIFINMCKVYILENSNFMRDEIVFCEGLVRFLSGMSFSLLFSIVIIIFIKPGFEIVLYIYLILFILFILKLRFIRHKEVATIFDAFAFVQTNKAL